MQGVQPGRRRHQGRPGFQEHQGGREDSGGQLRHRRLRPKRKGTLKVSEAKPFENKHGIKGHTSTATVSGVPTDDKCAPSAGKVVTASWINSNGDLAIWVLYTDAGVKDEVPDATIKKIMGSLRNYESSGDQNEPRG